MSLAALSIISLLYILRVQSIDSSDASSLSGFEFPEIDGSAVDDICRIVIVTDATITSTTTSTTTTASTTSPITRKVVETTKKSIVQSLPKKPEPKDTGAPIRTQPAAGGPITDHRVISLLYRLLANSRGHGADVQPIGRQPRGGQAASSDSDESVATWKIGSVSSDSSDES